MALLSYNFSNSLPQLVFIDSSHQYEHTLRELDIWSGKLVRGGIIFLHDVSRFSSQFDSSGAAGVHRGFSEWCASRGLLFFLLNSFVDGGVPGDFPYANGCGLGVYQKSII